MKHTLLKGLSLSLLVAVSACNSKYSSLPPYQQGNNTQVVSYGANKVLANELVFAGDPSVVENYMQEKKISAKLSRVDENSEIYVVRYAGDGDQNKTLTIIKDLTPRLDFVEPNFVLNKSDLADWPRDPEFIKLWGLNNIGQEAPMGLEGNDHADIGAVEAWKTTTGSNDIIVGIVDTGIDYTHPDLRDNMWINQKEKEGVAGIDDDGNGFVDDVYGWDFVSAGRTGTALGGMPGDADPIDDNSHGTHCAGTIGAVADNKLGVTGVNWHVRLMPLKFLDANGSGSSVDAFRAIRYGVKNGANVLSNSWGGGGYSSLLARAVEDANAAGVVFVAAAGNDASNNDLVETYPANYNSENIISVGASDNLDNAASFSNYGMTKVHVFAPGVNILSTIPLSIAKGNEPYAVYSGTSMATPHVAGIAALMMSADPTLKKNPAELKKRLIESSDIRNSLVGLSASHGRVNVARALKKEVNDITQFNRFVEEAHTYKSPSFTAVVTDARHTIQKEGAKAMRVHFDFVQIDEPYDSVYIYDKFFRLVAKLDNTENAGLWSPIVPGDTIHLRFVTSMLRKITYKTVVYDKPEDGFAAGAAVCVSGQRPDGKVECSVEDTHVDFASYNSEGFSVDKFSYITASN